MKATFTVFEDAPGTGLCPMKLKLMRLQCLHSIAALCT